MVADIPKLFSHQFRGEDRTLWLTHQEVPGGISHNRLVPLIKINDRRNQGTALFARGRVYLFDGNRLTGFRMNDGHQAIGGAQVDTYDDLIFCKLPVAILMPIFAITSPEF